jgi:hypothetical protein
MGNIEKSNPGRDLSEQVVSKANGFNAGTVQVLTFRTSIAFVMRTSACQMDHQTIVALGD